MEMEKMQQQSEKTAPEGVLGRSIRGGSWLTLGYVIERIVSVLSFFILARLLSPADFGVLAIVMLLPKFLQSITEPGFATAVMQKDGDVLPYLNPMWSVRVLRSALLAVVIFFLGPTIAAFFHVPQAETAIRLGGFALLLLNLGNPGEVFYFRALDFKKVFLRNLFRQIAYVAVALGFAFSSPSYWALVAATFALHGTEAFMTYLLEPYRPRFTWNWRPLKDITGYSKWIFGQGLLDQLYALIESTVVGRMLGSGALGLYSKAKSLAGVVPGFLTSVINMVSFNAYAKLKNEPEKIRDGFLKSIDLLSLIVTPAIAVIFVGGGTLVLAVLGEAWLPMTDPMRILMVYYALGTLLDISYRLLSGIGHPDKKVKVDLVKTALIVVLIVLLTPRYGIVGTSLALLAAVVPASLMTLAFLKRIIGLSYKKFLGAVIVPVVASFLMLLPVMLYKEMILALPFLILLSLLALLGILYMFMIIGAGKYLGVGPYKTLKLVLRHMSPV